MNYKKKKKVYTDGLSSISYREENIKAKDRSSPLEVFLRKELLKI